MFESNDRVKGREAVSNTERRTHVLLVIITVLFVMFALKAAKPVIVPVAFALFLIVLMWPLQAKLQKRMNRAFALLISLTIFIGALGVFAWLITYSVETVANEWPKYSTRFDEIYLKVEYWAWQHGFPLPAADSDSSSFSGTMLNLAEAVTIETLKMLTVFTLVVAFLALGLLEVGDFREKLRRGRLRLVRHELVEAFEQMAHHFYLYFLTRTLMALITGICTWAYCMVVGLEFAVVWGLLAGLLNYIPTVGSIMAVILPSLFAFIYYDNPASAWFVVFGLSGLELFLGNYVDPKIQGRFMSLSPFVVLLVLTFWTWMWGISGGILAVPMTVAVMIICNRYDRSRWIATLIAEVKDEDEEGRVITPNQAQEEGPDAVLEEKLRETTIPDE